MSLVRDTVANFIGGVSQQPDKLIYPNQSKSLINYHPDPAMGLKKRPPTEHIAKLCSPLEKHPLCHTIIKEGEEYEVLLTGDNIKVFDLEGNEKEVEIYTHIAYEVLNGTVKGYTDIEGEADAAVAEDTKIYSDTAFQTELEDYNPEDFTYTGNKEYYGSEAILEYITTNQPLEDLVTTTIADYTFIVNKTVVTKLEDEKFPNPYPHSALIFVKQGNYTADYKIRVNGEEKASYTATEDIATTKSNVICNDLYNDLRTNLGTTNWDITKQGSVICLKNKQNKTFTIQTEDSNADRDLYSFYQTAEDLSLLPTVAPNGFILKIIGENINIADDYYVQFQTSDGSSFGTGSWQECCAPDIQYKIDATTMPLALIRQSSGKFRLQRIDWTHRLAGDEESAPTPSFIGNTIQDIFTHKGRLGLLSVDKTIFSDTQDIFSFFKKTTLTELDTDPIDVGSNSKMVLLKHHLPFNESLLLFSETSEFSLRGGDIFSNSTVACDLAMEYPCSKLCKPINTGATGFFVYENGDFSRVMEIFISSTYTIDAREVTEQIPSYLPKGIYKIAGSTANNMACFLSVSNPSKIYVYNYYYSSEAKAQSAWNEWEFKNTKILNVDFKENWLYLVMQYEDGIYLEKINFSQKNKEKDLSFLFFLDRKVYFDNLIPEDGETELTLPYIPVNDIKIVTPQGFPLQDYTIEGNKIKIHGSYSTLITGNCYTSQWEMPLIFLRQQTSTGGLKVREGILMLRDINLSFSETGYFRVTVTPKYNTNITSSFEFTGKNVGMKSATLGEINVSDGTFIIPIIAKNDEITIEIINDGYMPCCFLSLEWLGDFVVRGGGK